MDNAIIFLLGVGAGICIKMVIDALSDFAYDFYNESEVEGDN
ncbi:MAG: hypothetical protein ACYDHF_08040 [Candidatus Cryosericum sp.]